MPDGDMAVAAPAGGNNSSDFVRKLYKMLEDPNYSEVVRWGNDGDSFVVLENEKFTKSILPKHFKHSNFASFVRQLNKYDFHKVRHSEENGQSPYGAGAWEFKHPEFRADRKDNLDNIRRKAPAPRKAPATDEAFPAAQQLMLMNETLAATQQQVQQLQEQYFELSSANKVFINEILHLQKVVKAQNQMHTEIMNHLGKLDDRRSRHSNESTPAFNQPIMTNNHEDFSQPPELRRAREILNSVHLEHVADRELERMSIAYHQAGASPDSAGSASVMMAPPGSAGLPPYMGDMSDMRHMVYPVGQTVGIDPFAADHINNLPYGQPIMQQSIAPDQQPPQPQQPQQQPQSQQIMAGTTPPTAPQLSSTWGNKKPRILLVEDDKTCARIGAKFLAQVECAADIARDGQEAIDRVEADWTKYDLIFMDIVMPKLDGISATAKIRQLQPNVPIIAMTSNINQQDIEIYFHWGMQDVLAKPFTKDGMIRILKKNLHHLLRNPPMELMTQSEGPVLTSAGGYTSTASINNTMQPNMSMKFDTTPIQSPSTSTSWNSPGMQPHASPTMAQDGGYLAAGSGNPMALTPGGSQRPPQQQQQYAGMQSMSTGRPIGRMPDTMQDRTGEKRQRLY